MKSKHILTSDEKLKHWGYGEWVEEPDLVEFEHENFKCAIKRMVAPEMNGFLFGGVSLWLYLPPRGSSMDK